MPSEVANGDKRSDSDSSDSSSSSDEEKIVLEDVGSSPEPSSQLYPTTTTDGKKKLSWYQKRKLKKQQSKLAKFKPTPPPTDRVSFMEQNKTDAGQVELNDKPQTVGGILAPTFASAQKLVTKGYKTVVTLPDLYGLPTPYQSRFLYKKFEANWQAQLQKEKPSILRAIVATLWKEILICLAFQVVFAVFQFITPIILPYLIDYLADPTIERWKGYVYIVVVFVVTMLGSFFYYNSWFIANALGIKVQVILIRQVYAKVLKIAPTKTSNSGQVVNLVGNDAQFVAATLPAFIGGIVAPLQIIIATIIMWQHIGPYALLALATIVLLFPLSAFLGKRFGTFRMEIQNAGDKRLKMTNELLAGIRIVKFYAWEQPFLKTIREFREIELNWLLGMAKNRSYLIGLLSNSTTLVLAFIFLFYGLFGPEVLSVQKAFSVLSTVNLLRLPFFMLPFTVTLIAQYTATFQRVQAYVTKPDIIVDKEVDPVDPNNVLEMENLTLQWDLEPEATPVLTGLNLKIRKGELVMVVGQVGSGKSTMVNAVLGDVFEPCGARRVKASISLVPQEPWIVNATVQENILFGEPFDETRYMQVIETCALGPDLVQLPMGDQTEIGERGITLSGGQKQRVSIARAMYANNKDFYILDDPFSAVDSHVGKHLFERGVQQYLQKNGKTVLLITNQLQYLPYADKIVVLHGNKADAIGSFEELKSTSKHFQSLLAAFGTFDDNDKKKEEEISEKIPKKEDPKSQFKAGIAKEKLESKESGLVGLPVYGWYIKSGGVTIFSFIIALLAFSAGASIVAAWWLTKWTESVIPGKEWHDKPIGFFVGIYVAFLVVQGLFSFGAYFLFAYFGTDASRILHNFMIEKVAKAPTGFFDVTPLGRIINRFAKEMSLVDALLPMQLSQYLFSVVTLLSIFAAMMFGSYYIIIAIVPVTIFYIIFQFVYRYTSVEIQRMEALSRAPIFSHLGETINGVSTIRAYHMQDTFNNMNAYRVDHNAMVLYNLRYCASWFGLVLDITGEFLVAAVYLSIVLTLNYGSGLDIGYAALAITYTSGLTSVLSNLNLNSVETETRMNSVERIKEYENLDEEPPSIIPNNRPPADWPTQGKIEFRNYSFAYKKGERVLKNITVTIGDKEKVGIVGRTGAGKSSLMQALFRFAEAEEGSIIIDGIDIATIGLQDLRTRLSLIPQDPTLFIGTVRYNLDPFNERTDKEIWEALKMVKLDKPISALPGKLDEPIAERGSNFSVGQRQMICMARALLRKSKILLMDEATASVDLKTDMLIQKMVRRNFKDMTVLTIAHRLNTIMDNDKVMVLDKGSLIEFDHPSQLLNNPNGILTGMVEATGPASAEYLRKIANGQMDVIEAIKNTPAESKEKKKKKSKRNLNETKEERRARRKREKKELFEFEE